MVDERKLSVVEVRKTISTSLGSAFCFVIALLWNNVVVGGIQIAGVRTTAGGTAVEWAILVATAVVLTIVMVALIVRVGRWGSKT